MSEFEKEFNDKSMVVESESVRPLRSTNDIGQVAYALAMAQSKIPTIAKNKAVSVRTVKGGTYRFQYADFDAITQAIKEPMSSEGLAYFFTIKYCYKRKSECLVLTIAHKSGQFIESTTKLRGASVTSYNNKLQKDVEEFAIKEFGGELTYLKRYMLSAMLGISTDEDDDGSMVSGDESTYTKNEEPDNKEWLNDGQFEELKQTIQQEIAKEGHAAVLARLEKVYRISRAMKAKVNSL